MAYLYREGVYSLTDDLKLLKCGKRIQTPKVFYFLSSERVGYRIVLNEKKEEVMNGEFLDVETNELVRAYQGIWYRCNEKRLFSKNFRVQKFNVEKDFQYFTFGDYVANDGVATQDHETGLTVSSVPFNLRGFSILDHTKYLVLTRDVFTIPNDDVDFFYEVEASYRATGLDSEGLQKYYPGIQILPDDLRLSAGALNIIDLQTGMVFDFLLSNNTIYALYEHLGISDSTDVFTFAKPVGKREPDQTHRLRIEYNKVRKRVRWLLDGNVVCEVVRPGIPLPDQALLLYNGEEFPMKEISSNELSIGFGTFTLLDFFPAHNNYENIGQSYTTGLEEVIPLTDVGSVYNKRMPGFDGHKVPQESFVYIGPQEVDGQGGILNVLSVKVGLTNDVCSDKKIRRTEKCETDHWRMLTRTK